MIFYKFYLADYIKDTHHLADAEDLAYRRLIDLYYLSEKPIPLDLNAVARKIRLDLDVIELVLNEFFDKQEDGYHNNRCDIEIQRYHHRLKINLAASDLARERRLSVTDPSRSPSRVPNQKSESDKNIKTISSAEPTRFDEFWSTWPVSQRKVAKASCKTKWVKHGLDSLADKILAHVRTMKGTEQWTTGFEPAPLTYLNQRRWEDETPQTMIRRAK